MNNSLETNKTTFEEVYKTIGGIKYPESHVIKLWHHFIKYHISTPPPWKILDFGCGTGTHCEYFKTLGFKPYGVDISSVAIAAAHECGSLTPDNIKLIYPTQDLCEVFNVKFDLIFSNLSIMYLSNSDIGVLTEQLKNLLASDGLVLFTMPSKKHYYYLNSTPDKDGLHKVVLTGRTPLVEYCNFVEDEHEMISMFSTFECIKTGYFDYLAPEGSTLSYYFIGKATK